MSRGLITTVELQNLAYKSRTLHGFIEYVLDANDMECVALQDLPSGATRVVVKDTDDRRGTVTQLKNGTWI